MSAYDHISGTLSQVDAQVVSAVPPGGNWRDLPEDFPSMRVAQIRRSAAAGEGSRSTYYGRLRLDRPSYTISTYFSRPGNGCFIHPTADRLITVREAARLQSFPDSFRFVGRGRARFVQVGNAVPPLLARAIGSVLPRGQVVDLFAGAGGLSLGLNLAGHDIVIAADIDRRCVEAIRANRHVHRVERADLADPHAVGEVVSAALAARQPGLPLALVGGPPCQGFSTAGHNDHGDPRNRLVFAFLEAVDLLEPDVVLMENVPALMWRRRQHVLREFVERLERRGYLVSIAILHAEAYAVPQLRRRLFVQARSDGPVVWPRPFRALCDPAHYGQQPGFVGSSTLPAASTVGDAIADLPAAATDDPDVPQRYARREATSTYAGWARGEVPVDELVPAVQPVAHGAAQLAFRDAA